jgi:hypothetical protein
MAAGKRSFSITDLSALTVTIPLYLINFVSIDWDAAIPLTPDVRSLLLRRTDLFGHEEE